MVAEQIFDSVGEADDPQGTAQKDGKQGEQALFHVLKEVGDGADDLVVQTEGEGHGAPGHSRDHVGDADDHAFYNVENKCHSLVLFRS